MRGPLSFSPSVLLMISVFVLSGFLYQNAYASMASFQQPINNQVITNSTVLFSGTYRDDPNPQVALPNGLSVTLTLLIDGSSVSPSANGGLWSYSGTIPDGPHHAIILVSDNTGQSSNETISFYVLTSHFKPTKYNMILIQYSQTCETLLSHNITSQCPTLDKLAPFDTTNQTYAGKIVQMPNGHWERTKPQIQQFWTFWQGLNKNIVCVECDFDFAHISAVPVIFIEPSGFTYPIQDYPATQSYNQTYWNGTQYLNRVVTEAVQGTTGVIGWNRYVDPSCLSANEVFSPSLLSDTIYYIDANCSANATKIFNTATLIEKPPPIDYAHTRQVIYSNWLHDTENKCISNTNSCSTQGDPNHTHDAKFGW